MDEKNVLDDVERTAILARLSRVSQEAASAPRAVVSRPPPTPNQLLAETKSGSPNFCAHCGHKLNEGAVTTKVTESKEEFNSNTSADKLLEACLKNRYEKEDEVTMVSDDVRKQIIEKVNIDQSGVIKNWRF